MNELLTAGSKPIGSRGEEGAGVRILVLGGTAWVGGTIARSARGHGHEVTCLARGSAAAPSGTMLVKADRDLRGAYAEVASGHWDAVIDVARTAAHVRSAVAALTDVGQYLFVSTGNVYADHSEVHQNETAAVLDPDSAPAHPGEAYGMAKVASERAIEAAFGPRALIARAGLIGGPGDSSGRSTYWPWRFAHPAGPVLVPDAAHRSTELIDVRDLAEWLVRCAEQTVGGVFNTVGPELPFGEHLAAAKQVARFSGAVVAVPEPWLAEQGVNEWMGPRSLPLWIADPDQQGFTARDGSAARAAGLTHRSLQDTLRDALAWEEAQPTHPHGAGLTDDEEQTLLRAYPQR